MPNSMQRFKVSAKELCNTHNMVLCAMMAALSVVLRNVASIDVGPYIRIGFETLPLRFVDCIFGPVTGALFDAGMDILNFLIRPSGAFFPGFTLSAALSGLIFGSILYKRKLTVMRVLTADLMVKLICNCLLGTLWLTMLYGKSFIILLPARVLKNAVMLPFDTFIQYIALSQYLRLAEYISEKRNSRSD